MADLIFMALLDLWATRTENYKMKSFGKHWDLNTVPAAYKAKSLSVALLEQILIGHLNFDRVLPEFAIQIYLHYVVDVAKEFIVYFVV